MKLGIHCELYQVVDGQMRMTALWCTATLADLDARRLPMKKFPCEAQPGVTADQVRALVESRIGDYPNVKAVTVTAKRVRP